MADKGNVGELSAQQIADIRAEAVAVKNTVGSISQDLKDSIKDLGVLMQENTKGYDEGFSASRALSQALQAVDAKTLASKKQQLDFTSKVRKAEEEATRLQAKANRLRAEMSQMTDKQLAAAVKVSRSYDNAADTLRDQARSAREITDQFEVLNKKVKVFDDLAGFFAEIPAVSKVFGEFQRAADAAGEAASKGGSGFGAGAKELGGALTKGLAAFGMSTILRGLKDADERTVDLSRNLNKSADESFRLVRGFNAAARGIQGLTGAELQKGATMLADSLGTTAVSSMSTSKELAAQVKYMGMSTDESEKQAEFSQATGQDIAKSSNEIRGQVMLSNLRNKTGIKYQAIMKDVANTSNATKLLMQGQGISITKAAIEAKKLGTTLAGIATISSSMLDFESSIANELEAELLTGGEIDNEKARALALKGDELGLAKELEKSGVLTKFANADNVLKQEALAKAYGLSKDAMADMVVKSKAMSSMKADDQKQLEQNYRTELNAIEALKKKGDLAGAALAEKQLSAKLGDGELERQLKNQTLEERRAETMAKLGEGMDALLPLLQLVGKAFTFIGNHAEIFSKALQFITGASILSKLGKVGNFFSKAAPAAETAATSGGGLGMLGKLGKAGLKSGLIGTAISGITNISKYGLTAESLGRTALSGGLSFLGGAAGSLVAPGAGTMVGGMAGGMAGDYLGDKIFGERTEPVAQDFIMRPGQKPLRFRKDDIIMGGTSLTGNSTGGTGGGNVEALLQELIVAVKQGSNIYLGTNKLNESIGLNLHPMR